MKLFRITFLSLAALTVVFIALLTGCSGSDPLSTTVGSLIVDVEGMNASSTQYEEGTLQLNKMIVTPAAEEDLESLGGAGVSLLMNQRFELDLYAATNTLPPANIPSGVFILQEVSFFPTGFVPLRLVDHDIPDPGAPCIDRITVLPETQLEDSIVSSALNGFSASRKSVWPNQLITIPSGDFAYYRIGINAPMLFQAYKNAFTCTDSEFLCERTAGKAPPCIIGFDPNIFITELEGLDWVTYGQE